jgi:hypothetical protein
VDAEVGVALAAVQVGVELGRNVAGKFIAWANTDGSQ